MLKEKKKKNVRGRNGMADHVQREGQKLMVITLFRVMCRTMAETTVKAKCRSHQGLTMVAVSGS